MHCVLRACADAGHGFPGVLRQCHLRAGLVVNHALCTSCISQSIAKLQKSRLAATGQPRRCREPPRYSEPKPHSEDMFRWRASRISESLNLRHPRAGLDLAPSWARWASSWARTPHELDSFCFMFCVHRTCAVARHGFPGLVVHRALFILRDGPSHRCVVRVRSSHCAL
jgi:hypothetical protein